MGVNEINSLTQHYIIKRRITERRKEIIELLEKEGLHLLVAPTDSGKTYSFMNKYDGIFRELSKMYKNRAFLMACPNRIQNEQNHKSYGVYALVGGVKINIEEDITSMVYEKAEEVLKEYAGSDLEITLVIDEAHQLMYAQNYRREAINALEKLTDMAFNTLHITATPQTLKAYYSYNNIYEFELENAKDANNFEKLFVVQTEDIQSSLIHMVKSIVAQGKQAMVLIDSKDSIATYEEFLKGHSINTRSVIQENKKGNEVYDSIINKSIIPHDVDVLLGTSALECGTNILNENLVMIIVVPRRDRLNFEKIEQGFARPRKKNEFGILLTNYYEQDEKGLIESVDIITKKLKFECDRAVRMINNLINFFKLEGFSDEDAVSLAKANLSLKKQDGTSVGLGVVEINAEGIAEINKKSFVVKTYQIYDAQFIDKKNLLLDKLKEHVKADKFVYVERYDKKDEKISSELKEIKNANKEVKESLDAKARNIIQKYSSDIVFESWLESEDVLEIANINDEMKDELNFLKNQKKQLKIVTDMIKKSQIPFTTAMQIYNENEKGTDIKYRGQEYVYIRNNKAIALGRIGELDLRYEYGLIRRVLDPVCIKQGKLSEAIIIELIDDLIQYKEFSKYSLYNKYLDAKTKAEKEKRFEQLKEYIITRISMIYKTSVSSSGQVRISSLRKSF